MAITVRSVTDLDNYEYFQELQRRVWGSPPIDITPIHVTVAIIRCGGGLICAFDEDGPEEMGRMVGGAFWWYGVGVDPADEQGSKPRLRSHSHMAGVLPEWQSHGIGARLKLGQREDVLAQGLTNWMTWTYDPLYRRNAAFNIRRLGCTSSKFARDIYGDLPDALNAGWPSDRLTVDWRLDSPDILLDASKPRSAVEWDTDGMELPQTRLNVDGLPEPPDGAPVLDGRTVALPLPSDMDVIRRQDKVLGMAWRLYMRHALESAFAAGYTIVDCLPLAEYGWRYIMIHDRK